MYIASRKPQSLNNFHLRTPSDIIPYIYAFALEMFLDETDSLSLTHGKMTEFSRFRNVCERLARIIQSLGYQRIMQLFETNDIRWWILEIIQDERLSRNPSFRPILRRKVAKILGIEGNIVYRVSSSSDALVKDWFSLSPMRTTKSACARSMALFQLNRLSFSHRHGVHIYTHGIFPLSIF